jgi:hypothetical protein
MPPAPLAAPEPPFSLVLVLEHAVAIPASVRLRREKVEIRLVRFVSFFTVVPLSFRNSHH